MINRKRILTIVYALIATAAFSLSIFKWDNQVWIAAWIAPALLIRIMRNHKWITAVIFGFVVLQISSLIGLFPLMTSYSASSMEINSLLMLKSSAKAGTLYMAPLFLIPFILDKALYKRIPGSVASLAYPSGVVVVELLYSFISGTLCNFGHSLMHLSPLVVNSSLFGIFGLSFLVAWFAPVVNNLWEEKWNLKKLGFSGLVYFAVMAVILIYGGITIVFPKKADAIVPVAGITLDCNFDERVLGSGLDIINNPDLNLSEYTEN